ncbi:T9SS type A sorting domain-containing protein [candidate division KSB1 bacterium]|nr:T9SS type A sorting domain-containing protein [candidate division KSB1 bacterium]
MGYNLNDALYCAIGSFPDSDLSAPDWKLEFADDFLNAEAPPGGGYRVGGVVIDDFDEDGNMEIFTSHWQDVSATRVFESDGIDNYVIKHTNTPETLILYPSFDGAFANPIFHDFDGDGDPEFLISDIHGHIFVITKEASNGFEDFGPSAWTYVMNWPTVPDGGFMRSGYMGDLDQDSKPDIYYNDYRAQAILDLEYQGGPVTDPNSWIPYEILKMPGVRFGNVRPAGDLDGDGLEELVLNMGGLMGGQNLQILESQHMQISVEESETKIPDRFTLSQNYPNPFNPVTTISYQLPEPSDVQLSIYNLNGQLIETLVDIHQQAGNYEARWNVKSASSGIYLYKLIAGEYTAYKKCMLLR